MGLACAHPTPSMSIEKAGSDLACVVNHTANFDSAAGYRVIDEVGLKTETSQPHAKVVDRLTNGWKIRQQIECADQSGRIGIRLIGPELPFRIFIDLRKLLSRPDRYPVISHDGALRHSPARLL